MADNFITVIQLNKKLFIEIEFCVIIKSKLMTHKL